MKKNSFHYMTFCKQMTVNTHNYKFTWLLTNWTELSLVFKMDRNHPVETRLLHAESWELRLKMQLGKILSTPAAASKLIRCESVKTWKRIQINSYMQHAPPFQGHCFIENQCESDVVWWLTLFFSGCGWGGAESASIHLCWDYVIN